MRSRIVTSFIAKPPSTRPLLSRPLCQQKKPASSYHPGSNLVQSRNRLSPVGTRLFAAFATLAMPSSLSDSPLTKNRPACVPIGRLLEHVRGPQQALFLERGRLQA